MKAKTKFYIIKISLWVLLIPYFYGVTKILAKIGLASIWGNMFETGLIENITQWITLILYRFAIYFLPAIVLMFFRFDKRMKKITRYIIWQNQVFCIYLFCYAIIQVLALNMIEKFPMRNAFNSLTFVVSLAGYIFTFLKKKKIEFDSNGAIIDEKPYKS